MEGELVPVGKLILTPAQAKSEAITAAKELMGMVKPFELKGKLYLRFEDWQTLGVFVSPIYGAPVTAKVVEAEQVEGGYQARAVAVCNNVEISAAEALCLRDEANWKTKPEFQLKSMAQTRACAKALRNVLAWVAVLGGPNVAPTPAEEMNGAESKSEKDITIKDPDAPATGKQAGMIWGKIVEVYGKENKTENFVDLVSDKYDGREAVLTDGKVDITKTLTKGEASSLIEYLESKIGG